MSIRKRLTLYYSLSIVAIALLLVGVFLWALVHAVTGSARDAARTHAELAATMLRAGDDLDRPTLARLSNGITGIIARDAGGRIVVQSQALEFEPGRSDAALWRRALATGQAAQDEGSVRGHLGENLHDDAFFYAVPVAVPGTPIRVVEAISSYSQTGRSGFAYEVYLVAFTLALIALAIVIGSLLARAALAPVGTIVRSTEEMGAGDLSRRLPIKNPNDELGRLSATLNGLLSRLEVAFKEREAALAHERRFIADASHELRTPLTSILGYARMLMNWGLRDAATAEESVAAIAREASRMSLLVDGLLSLAHGDERAPLDLRHADLAAIVADAVDAARLAASDKLTLVYQPPAGQVVALLDINRIRQLVGILLDNAVKYTEPGGQVAIAVRARDSWAELEVADTGIGIPAADLPHIFERFYRVEAARSTGGNGLGLAIALQVAEAHQGSLDVESDPGHGSRFTFRVPLVPEPEARPLPASSRAHSDAEVRSFPTLRG